MATVQWADSSPPATAAQVAAFEARTGLTLPEAYRGFLTTTNGGEPTPDRLVVPGWYGGATCVSRFFALEKAGLYDLERSYQNARDYVPTGFLPIAVDTGGNMLCLGLAGGAAGRVYFWDHEDPQGAEEKNLWEVAGSFEDLFAQLLPDED